MLAKEGTRWEKLCSVEFLLSHWTGYYKNVYKAFWNNRNWVNKWIWRQAYNNSSYKQIDCAEKNSAVVPSKVNTMYMCTWVFCVYVLIKYHYFYTVWNKNWLLVDKTNNLVETTKFILMNLLQNFFSLEVKSFVLFSSFQS